VTAYLDWYVLSTEPMVTPGAFLRLTGRSVDARNCTITAARCTPRFRLAWSRPKPSIVAVAQFEAGTAIPAEFRCGPPLRDWTFPK
jgi:hypothetical protein